jgi:hypothetical protein
MLPIAPCTALRCRPQRGTDVSARFWDMLGAMRHRPFTYSVFPSSALVALVLHTTAALGQSDGAAAAGVEPASPAEADATGAEAAPQASPDVQSQVGLGTEKEEDEAKAVDTKAATDEAAPPEAETPTYGHGRQFGLRSNLALGYKVLLRFDDSPPCDPPTLTTEEEKQVCGYATPPSLDFALSFGLFDALEPYLWFRMGLGDHEKTFTAATRWAGAGVRIYTMSDSQLKLFFEPAAAVELEGGTADAPPGIKYDTDFVGHVHFGLQYDFLAQLGLYFSAGPNVSFVRAIGTEFEGAVGLQVRAP